MPVFRSKNGAKTTRLYLDEIKRLHATLDLLADLALNQPAIANYKKAHDELKSVCDLWPIPKPKGKKSEAELPVDIEGAVRAETASDPQTA